MRQLALAAVVAALTMVALVPAARADQVFHSERIPLIPVNGAPLQSGFVVDIHTNGPIIYALERYQLNGAMPNTTYQVVSQIYVDPTCTANFLGAIPDATLQTNAAGDGEAKNVPISPAQIDQFGLHNTTLGINWQVLLNGAVVYQTGCIPVRLD
jgi:hypothetical protein